MAEEATGAERERLFEKAAERYPQLSELARKTNRVIPVLILTPHGDRVRPPEPGVSDQTEAPVVVDRATFQAGRRCRPSRGRRRKPTRVTRFRAARRRLPMVEVDACDRADRRGRARGAARRVRGSPAVDRLLPHVVGRPAGGGAVRRLHVVHRPGARALVSCTSRDVTYATFCQGPYDESVRYRDFMGWDEAVVFGGELRRGAARRTRRQPLLPGLLPAATATGCSRPTGRPDVASRRWTTATPCFDRTVYGRQETWEDSPASWPQLRELMRSNGRPTAQWSRLHAGRSDDLATAPDQPPAHTESQ